MDDLVVVGPSANRGGTTREVRAEKAEREKWVAPGFGT